MCHCKIKNSKILQKEILKALERGNSLKNPRKSHEKIKNINKSKYKKIKKKRYQPIQSKWFQDPGGGGSLSVTHTGGGPGQYFPFLIKGVTRAAQSSLYRHNIGLFDMP